jgi:hypothetical protein
MLAVNKGESILSARKSAGLAQQTNSQIASAEGTAIAQLDHD